jgi:shikimate kinase
MTRVDNVFLVGPMGAGKSTIGRALATQLGKRFADCDHEIEFRTGASIPLIFEIEGEEGFRRRESSVLDELTRENNLVLATGGGVVLAEVNRQLLKSRGIVIYLQAPIEVLVKRTAHDRNRPLLANVDRRSKLIEIMKVREPFYREVADIVVSSGGRPASAVVRDIVKQLKDLSGDARTAG